MTGWSGGLILKVMERLGFCHKWISLLKECISLSSLFVLINGSPSGHFSPSRGLRQGDPFPPFLFILGSEVLSRLLHNTENIGYFKGLAPACPKVSHLLFANDLIIFAKTTVKDARAIQSCIELCQLCSGQLVNAKKSAIMFSKRVPRRMQRAITRVLGLKSTLFHAKYLGLPLCNEKSRSNTFEQVVERVALKVQGWKQNL